MRQPAARDLARPKQGGEAGGTKKDRRPGMIVSMLLLTPLAVGLATPFIRPFRWSRLFWTYVIPLVPLTCWWDGVVSQLRAYTPAE